MRRRFVGIGGLLVAPGGAALIVVKELGAKLRAIPGELREGPRSSKLSGRRHGNGWTRSFMCRALFLCACTVPLAALFGWALNASPSGPEPGNPQPPPSHTGTPAVATKLGLPPGPVLAWAERQSCNGASPAVLLRWTPAENSLSTYTIERLDGGYTASVDTATEGFAHLVTDGLEFNQSYEFRVIAHNNFDSTQSNVLATFVVNEECLGAGTAGSPPGPFVAWMEPAFCDEGSVGVELHWSAAEGAESYTLERFAAAGGSGRVVEDLKVTTFLDSVDIVPGVAHAYFVTAENSNGTTGAPFSLPFRPRPDLCDDEGLPGNFQVNAGAPFCAGGGPAIPIEWTESSGADSTYHYRVLGQRGLAEGGAVDTESAGLSFDATSGVRADQVHELFMVATDANDSSKKRHSNSAFVYVPADVCGPMLLAPEVFTQPANGVTESSAILRSQVKANGSPTFAYFEWGKTTPYTDLTSAVAIGSTPLFFQKPSRQRSGLECETEYHYRVVAWNDAGTSVGSDRVFTTTTCPSCGQADLDLTGLSVTTLETYEACNSISVGPGVSVESGGSLVLTAPVVIWKDGFSVRSGGSVKVGPPL